MMCKDSNRLGIALVVAMLGMAAGCGDDSEDVMGDAGLGGTGGSDGGADGDDAGLGGSGHEDAGRQGSGGATYAFVTQVFGAGSADNQSYVVLADRVEREQPLDIDEAEVTVPGRALGVGPRESGVLFVGSDSGPTVTRYDLQEDGSLEEGDTVSFQGEGVSSIGEYPGQFYFVSETKAYFFDGATAQVVIWNPEEMTVRDDIPLDDLVIEGATLTFSSVPVEQDGQVITFAGWRQGAEVPSQAGVVVVDTESDEATIVTDDRCGYVRDGVLHDDGYIYMATEAYGSAVYRLNEDNAAAPCMLRFDPDAMAFDEGFHVELDALFDGRTAGALIVGPDGEPYIEVLDEGAFEIMEDTHPRVLASAAGAWEWARLELGEEPSADVLDVEPGNGSVVLLRLGDRVFIPQYQGRDSTDFREVTEDGPGDVTMSSPGLVFSAVKLR